MSKGRRSAKINQSYCGQCKLVVNEEKEDFIECDKCKKIYHVVCTKLSRRQYEFYVHHKEEEYECHLCSSGADFKAELREIKTELKKLDQLDQLAYIKESVSFMSKQFDEIIKVVAENKKKLDMMQKENKLLKDEVKTLKNSIKVLNDHRCKNDCIISGLEMQPGLTATDAVLKLTRNVGVELKPHIINDAYFIKNRNNTDKQMVVVQFDSKRSKDSLMAAKPKLKENEATQNVFVRDYLGRETLSLFNYAKSLKNVGYRSVYVAAGKVYVKRNELSRSKFIGNEEEVDHLLLEATTNIPRMRRSQNNVPNDAADEET